ncbi:MAG: 16S rRNA (cytidine(1402)-2'-O)-methyltransferase [Acidimicrobiaceae bacterium]|nr:16S rRNA (cytidine(1402)-2'-O)-methyltransferase [Acidimicrobiaceae bacterium]MXW76071.1 16S rRNA (cytidine(1402)-2'-O)-methyltransferase [Acidimicrobiaceae bacterium]MYA75031.1 16S rRNA (cytidine(1402)-2'-O)-methyltransferase [Acidimicrobiaceae bacterium]MYC43240.1 16S rRNA (cytidine(1402)-2'-O)-methyltransferase [Acidimicrobiaceae bacterium]MYD06212.1 16S rRNA (cytidine(1402)-2'-O)-methyltransferase [Acidimicrobiaceae bacterium]
MTPALVIVATPIGNLADLSPRAVEELAGAELVCCEDTRRTGRLLSHAGVRAKALRRVDAHTEAAASTEVVGLIAAGHRVVFVSDSGTPGVCDPGQRLVAAVVNAGHEVVVVPGPSAVVAALMGSGFLTDRFAFEGFLPRRGRERESRLAQLSLEQRTCVLYESPKRIAATLSDLARCCGTERRAVVARELTKLHEEFVRGSLAELVAWSASEPKGEIVVVLEGAPPAPEPNDEAIVAALDAALARGLSSRDAASRAAVELGVAKRRVYELLHRA